MAYLKKHIYEIGILFLVVLLFITNYKSGTYLTGWDNLQTDLNPLLGVKRALFAVWEEYQSFGLVSGMAHAADLLRAVFIFLISFIMPQNMIRYFFHFLMLFVGVIGMYRLLRMSLQTNDIYAFFGALFYMLNFGTVQIFFLPYEPFSIFYAFLPWCVWIFLILLNNGTTLRQSSGQVKQWNNILLFFLINLLITPAFYVQTFFVVYILILAVISLGIYVNQLLSPNTNCHPSVGGDPINTGKFANWIPAFAGMTNKIRILKKAVVLFFLIFTINFFWILPQLYFLKTSGNVVADAKINALSTEDTLLQNREKGTLPYFLRMEGFYYNLFNIKGGFLFEAWQKHNNLPFIGLLPYLFMTVVILGLFRKNKYRMPFILVLVLVMILLLSATPPFSWINDFIRKNAIINQIFRSPFTKFIIPYSLVASYFFASGLIVIKNVIASERSERGNPSNVRPWLTGLLRRFTPRNDGLFSLIIFILLIIYSLPAFTGNYISPEMKVKVSQEYFELMDYFKGVDKNKRIALLPDYTFWGWFFTKWGYNGSGFLWYGIDQPMVSRTFDGWSNKSESYFWEAKSASEAEDIKKFDNLLEKYNIDYLILDHSLLPVSSTLKGMQYDRINSILEQSKKVNFINSWKNLALYEVKHNKKIDSFVSLSANLPNIGPGITLTNDDTIYQNFGDYQTDNATSLQAYYPFLDLTTQTRIRDKNWQISEDDNNIYLTGKSGINTQEYQLLDNSLDIQIGSQNLILSFPKKLSTDFNLKNTNVFQCGYRAGKTNKEINNNGIFLSSSNGAVNCFGYDNPYLDQKLGYIIKINDVYKEGSHLFFYVLDETKRQTFVEDRLRKDQEYYILSPRFQYGVGYNFNFQNTSYENQTSANALNDLSLYTFPYDQIKNLKFVKNNEQIPKADFSNNFNVSKINYFLYQIDLSSQLLTTNYSLQTLILFQSFHPGWEAYYLPFNNGTMKQLNNFFFSYFPYFFGEKITNHFPVNNWANGWKIDPNINSNTVILIFWPQYLEFIGFIILTGSLGFLVVKSLTKN